MFPGGDGPTFTKNLYSDRIYAIYNYAIEKNKSGKYYFIWGVCQGFQQILMDMADNNPNVIDGGFDDHTEHKVEITD